MIPPEANCFQKMQSFYKFIHLHPKTQSWALYKYLNCHIRNDEKNIGEKNILSC